MDTKERVARWLFEHKADLPNQMFYDGWENEIEAQPLTKSRYLALADQIIPLVRADTLKMVGEWLEEQGLVMTIHSTMVYYMHGWEVGALKQGRLSKDRQALLDDTAESGTFKEGE